MRTKAFLLSLALLLSLGGAQTYVQLVLDASGSMWNTLADGRYRIVAAKEVLSDLISRLPADPDLNVGLRIYGSETFAISDEACQDSRLFVPMQGLERQRLLDTVQATNARGATPIAYSLEQAINDFPASGRRLIILVTDGEESCAGDLRTVAGQLTAQGIELRIIGFDLAEAATQGFAGIGQFENTRSAADLAAALGRAVETVGARDSATYPVTVTLTRNGSPVAEGASVSFVDGAGGAYPFGLEAGAFTTSLAAGRYTATVQDALASDLRFSDLSVTPGDPNTFSFELAETVTVTLSVSPSSPLAGADVSVTYVGAAGNVGFITLAPTDADESVYLHYYDVREAGGEVALRTPDDVATLEARYVVSLPGGGNRVLGRSAPFSTVPTTATLSAPAEAGAGAQLSVTWTGPDNQGDYITVVLAGAEEGSYLSYAYTTLGSPVTLTVPLVAGAYELRYVTGGLARTLTHVPLTVISSSYGLQAPAEVEAGAAIAISWTGPDNQGDYITIVPEGTEEGVYGAYAYTADGNPVTIYAPSAAGRYELRYTSEAASPNPTLAQTPIEVRAASITLTAPAAVGAGESFQVSWTGPDGAGDYLTIVPVGADEGAYLSYAYTSVGATLTLTAPDEAGAYEIRYASDRVRGTFAWIPITVR